MLNLVSMRTLALALGLASAVFVMSPVAHAATTATHQWADLGLSITDANGNTTANNGFASTGDSIWQSGFFLGYSASNIGDVDNYDMTPQPVLQNTTLVRDLGVASGQVTLSLNDSGKASITTELNSLPGVPLSSASSSDGSSLAGGLAPVFFQRYLTSTDSSLDDTPVTGGIWLDAGSTATISGHSTAAVSLDPTDFEGLTESAFGQISAYGIIDLGLISDGGLIGAGPEVSELTDGVSATVKFLAREPGNGPLQNTQTGFFSASITNDSGAGQWLIFDTIGVIDVVRGFAPVITPPPTGGNLIPEPSTYALMGLGLVGVALAARRQRARNC